MKRGPLLFAALLAVTGAMQPVSVRACGFESPQAIALGALNLSYPDAVHVLASVWRAEDSGLLSPRRDQSNGSGPLAFYLAAASVKTFGTKLAEGFSTESGRAISVVLIPQVMWTRFELGPEGLVVQSHAEGPRNGDLVIVSEVKVVRDVVNGKLDSATVEEKGLLRLYGSAEQVATARVALARISRTQ